MVTEASRVSPVPSVGSYRDLAGRSCCHGKEGLSSLAQHPKVPVETKFVIETPRRALVKAAEDAALLVVGNRGIGSAPKMLLGPVTQAALYEAPCPVAVVPAQRAG
ncbi:hypothetical protein Misp02_62150 [Microtetraspora sp. NBRC 16547]|nr:hypothetical protein Misp02_62150 [Microtetraspora sp. NBRC 16547]